MMSNLVVKLAEILQPQKIASHQFSGKPYDVGLPQLFGGHILAQSLAAMMQTVAIERQVHSLQGYFVRPGNCEQDLIYQVKLLRDGESFSLRSVEVRQNEEVIFVANASFQRFEVGFSHQCPMPNNIPAAQDLPSLSASYKGVAHLIPEKLRRRLLFDGAIEVRQVKNADLFMPAKEQPIKHIWFRLSAHLPSAEVALHNLFLCYASDFNLLTTAMLPHAVSLFQPFMQVASIEHSIRFHAPVNLNEWTLYCLESPWTGNGRGFATGQIFDLQGKLLASTAQEGLIRVRKDRLV